MKYLLFLGVLFSFSAAQAQADTGKIEQYCELVATGKILSNKVTITVDFGLERPFLSNSTAVKDEITGKVKKFNSVVDALNFMGSQGWTLVNAFPVTGSGGSQVYHYYFRKQVDKVN